MSADISWVLDRVAVGGGIFTMDNMEDIASRGITHIINTQIEFDDSPLADMVGIKVCWCPVADDFSAPDDKYFYKAMDFVENDFLKNNKNRILVHCAAGVHRGPMFASLVMLRLGKTLKEAHYLIERRRPIATFPEVYSRAVGRFFEKYWQNRKKGKDGRDGKIRQDAGSRNLVDRNSQLFRGNT